MNRLFRRGTHDDHTPDDAPAASKFKPGPNAAAASEATAALMVACPRCKEPTYTRELEHNLRVCPKCGLHQQLTAAQRVAYTLDPDSFVEWDGGVQPANPLGFEVPSLSYRDKLDTAQKKTGAADAALTGRGAIIGELAAFFIADFAFMGGTMGSVYGEKLARAAERAVAEQLPLVTFNTSGGARMQEGLFALMQMAKTAAAVGHLGAAGLPHIAVLTDPCYGGVTASYATLADVILAEPGARIGFAGKDSVAKIMKGKLPDDAQTAEFEMAHGMIDGVVPRRELREKLATVLALYRAPRLAPPLDAEYADAERETPREQHTDAQQQQDRQPALSPGARR